MTTDRSTSTESNSQGTDRLTILAFIIVALLGGSNVVAVKFSNLELPPFWGATIRFASAGLIFWVIVLIRRVKVPGGRALAGALIYGTLTVGVSYAFLYWGLLYVPASMSALVLSMAPLLTFFLALAHGQEKFRWQGLLGALVALVGILIVLGNEIGSSLPLLPVLALMAGVAAIGEGNVLYKSFPKGDPLAVNALAVSTGALLLLLLSIFNREVWSLPSTNSTWIAYTYLVLGGSVLLFYLYLYVLGRWTASATSYIFLLIPVSTIILAALITDEQITTRFLLGSGVVLIGIWIGAIAKPKKSNIPQQVENRTPNR